MNKVYMSGKVDEWPEKRLTPQGRSVTRISLKVPEHIVNSDGKQIYSTWMVVFWDQLADYISRSIQPRTPVKIEGRATRRSWTLKDGTVKTAVEILGSSIEIINNPEEIMEACPAEDSKPIVQQQKLI